MIAHALFLFLPLAASSQVVARPSFSVMSAPVGAYAPALSSFAAPVMSAVALSPAALSLHAAPALAAAPVAAQSGPARAVPLGPAAVPLSRAEPTMDSVLRTQGWLLGVLSKPTGLDITSLSMAMSAMGGRLTLSDWADILRGLLAEEAGPTETEEALLASIAHSPFARRLGADNRADAGDWSLLAAQLKGLPEQVAIARNQRFMAWARDLAAGRPTPAFAPGPEVSLRPDGSWRIRLGWLEHDGNAIPLVVVSVPVPGAAPSLAYFLDPVFSSTRLDPSMRAALSGVAAELEKSGVRTATPR